jgi:RNA polymerase-binding transcription factor DksA
MTDLDHAVPAAARRRHSAIDLQVFRADLERQRRFRIEQLRELAASSWAVSDEMEEVAAALRTAAELVLAEIDAALQRIELGRYGVCQRCNEAIPRDRLEVLPMASLCMPCQFAKEMRNGMCGQSHVQQASKGTKHRRGAGRRLTAGRARPRSADREQARPDVVEVWGSDRSRPVTRRRTGERSPTLTG